MSGWSGASSLHAEAGQAVRYRGMTDCFVRTVKEEGMKALFKVSWLVIVFRCPVWQHAAISRRCAAVQLFACRPTADRLPCCSSLTSPQSSAGVLLPAWLHLHLTSALLRVECNRYAMLCPIHMAQILNPYICAAVGSVAQLHQSRAVHRHCICLVRASQGELVHWNAGEACDCHRMCMQQLLCKCVTASIRAYQQHTCLPL